MSRLFECSTPERRKAGEILPLVPPEIYLFIFEFLAPPTGRLIPEELDILSNLTGVCRLFANICLPRIFEFSDFSDAVFGDGTQYRSHSASHDSLLRFQITRKTPLALSLVEKVRSCRLTDWPSQSSYDRAAVTGSCTLGLFLEKYLSGIMKMRHVHELKFSHSAVGAEHWRAIASLELLEKLSFSRCTFTGTADDAAEERIQVKATYLQILRCVWDQQPMIIVDTSRLRTFVTYLEDSHPVCWFPRCALTEFHLVFEWPRIGLTITNVVVPRHYIRQLWAILALVPSSLEVLNLWFHPGKNAGVRRCIVINVFEDSIWRNLPLLRSITLQAILRAPLSANTHSALPDSIDILSDVEPFTQKLDLGLNSTEIRLILSDQRSSSPNLVDADFFGNVFRFVKGEWLEVL